ncbi:heavy metal-associated isoprenylated plant protein 41 isoform X1 [Brachypodium distachyon]|uniref:heavy metal-associated isoprenylated plant protein 41 isoform X1 n=1 Tax=Brachypodium distachyon TaxID=15368 RepID=UPI000234F537|nr:heavy metal-associated isoprenylated plant protein 41 isoform X1 [Brachypodium distachyon]|eukprot:XP_003576655.1 heavy metal-associated isoprenylated plant protein 41 isoform X1 [Brachypodium distachyon]
MTRRGRKGKGVKWLKHYSSAQSILIIGDGDFSFSMALATAFGSGANLVATSLDSYEALICKYSEAESNVMELKITGATVLHGVNAKKMKSHTYLKTRQFDRIVFNFPHAGFKAKDYKEVQMVSLHKVLVKGFLANARCLLHPYGEIHISHKIGYPYDEWNLEQLASESSLTMIKKVKFQKEDYPGYNQKRGDGAKCNRSFPLGECCTFQFCIKSEEPEEETPLVCLVAALANVNLSQSHRNYVTV